MVAQNRKISRRALSIAAALGVAGLLGFTLWPRPMLLDFATVERGTMRVVISEEGRTRVQEPYVVSSPVAGMLGRVTVLPGDQVIAGETIVAQMRPANPAILDIRTREQAVAAVNAAEAALNVARADLNAAQANRDFADSEHSRIQKLVDRGISSVANLERALQVLRVAGAAVDTSKAAIGVREAELTNAKAQLIGIDDQGLAQALGLGGQAVTSTIPIRAPIDGRILRLLQKSETILPVGQPILEIGDVQDDLEVMSELLSADAVQVTVGDAVIISNWGGPRELTGHVDRIDPYGYTKHSALGVEEQRVEVTIKFDGVDDDLAGLGHGYRVDVNIVIWEHDDVLIVPSSALFRTKGEWALYAVTDGKTQLRTVGIGRNNGLQAQVLSGLNEGDIVVPFPSSGLADGQTVARR